MSGSSDKLVLVTGGSGFIAMHCIIQLLQQGYQIRTTVRSTPKQANIIATLTKAEGELNVQLPKDRVSFAVADLNSDDGWKEATQGCDYVLHVASPFPTAHPKNEDEIIVPAVQGTLRVLQAAKDSNVKRVVLTSSFAAIGYSNLTKENENTTYTEAEWTDVTHTNDAYIKSKTLAEKAAWEFVAKPENASLELAAINPAIVLGPMFSNDMSTSFEIVKRMLNGEMSIGCPRVWFGIVDVRDVAAMHIKAMITPAANGQRFIAAAGVRMSFLDMSLALRARLGARAKKAPTSFLPDWLLYLASWFSPELQQLTPRLGNKREVSNANARNILGHEFISNEDAIVAAAESLIKLGLVKV